MPNTRFVSTNLTNGPDQAVIVQEPDTCDADESAAAHQR